MDTKPPMVNPAVLGLSALTLTHLSRLMLLARVEHDILPASGPVRVALGCRLVTMYRQALADPGLLALLSVTSGDKLGEDALRAQLAELIRRHSPGPDAPTAHKLAQALADAAASPALVLRAAAGDFDATSAEAQAWMDTRGRELLASEFAQQRPNRAQRRRKR